MGYQIHDFNTELGKMGSGLDYSEVMPGSKLAVALGNGTGYPQVNHGFLVTVL